jgi:subtilisin family serine protease
MMKVTVTQFLNVRIGKPSVNAPTLPPLAPGSVLDVDGKLYKGDRFEGVNTWLKDEASNYYWSGATNFHRQQTALVEVTPLSNTRFNYNQLLVLDAKYKQTKGEGITVAIVDTGCSPHRALGNAVLQTHSVDGSEDTSDLSTSGHGTFLAGIIAAREDAANEVVGVAPKAKLLIVKAVDDLAVEATRMLTALQWIDQLATPPEIINLSLDFSPGADAAAFETVLRSLTAKGILVVAAGQNETAIYSNAIFYPATDPRVLGIGAVSKASISDAAVNAAIDFVLPNWSFHSLQNFGNLYTTLHGCSISVAVVSGALALIRSFLKQTGSPEKGTVVLSGAAANLLVTNFNDTLKVYKP